MNFNTFEFLLIFLPVTLVLFYIVPARFRLVVLLTSSLLFYGYSGLQALGAEILRALGDAGAAVDGFELVAPLREASRPVFQRVCVHVLEVVAHSLPPLRISEKTAHGTHQFQQPSP